MTDVNRSLIWVSVIGLGQSSVWIETGVAGHTPISARTETHTAHLGTIGQTGTFKVLTEKSAVEGLQPF